MMNDAVQSRRPSGTRGENGFVKALGEYSSLAVLDAAKEAPCDYAQRYPATGARQIRQLPVIGLCTRREIIPQEGHAAIASAD